MIRRIKLPNARHHPVVEGDFLTPCYHAPLIKYFFLARLAIAFNFIRNKKFETLLEIGFGSGVFFPSLKQVSKCLYGVDINPKMNDVKKMCEKENLKVELSKGDVVALPYKDEAFDCVISMSTLEHIVELDKAVSEIWRVLKKGGIAVLGFPVANKITDFLLRYWVKATHKKRLDEIHPSSHRDILQVVRKVFNSGIVVKKIPKFLPLDISLYCCCACKREENERTGFGNYSHL